MSFWVLAISSEKLRSIRTISPLSPVVISVSGPSPGVWILLVLEGRTHICPSTCWPRRRNWMTGRVSPFWCLAFTFICMAIWELLSRTPSKRRGSVSLGSVSPDFPKTARKSSCCFVKTVTTQAPRLSSNRM